MANFDEQVANFARDFKSLTDREKTLFLETILALCGHEQLRFLHDELPKLVKRDFLTLLPTELALNVANFLDCQTLARCFRVSKSWNTILSNCTEPFARACKEMGLINDRILTKEWDWKWTLMSGMRRMRRLLHSNASGSGFKKREFVGHTERVTALCYNDGMLASGSDDRTVRLWDVTSGECKYNLTCHTCADLKFDNKQVVTASYDHTLACWEWTTGKCLRKYLGHVGAVICVDCNAKLDMVVSGSSDCSVKLWQMSTGKCLSTINGHENWLNGVLLPQLSRECQAKLQREHVAVSLSEDCIKVCSVSASDDYHCIATLLAANESLPIKKFFPRLQCNGREVIFASGQGVGIWNLETFQLTRLFEKCGHLLVVDVGEIFSLCWKKEHNCLQIMNNKKNEVLSEVSFSRSRRFTGFRFRDCVGEVGWLSDCSPELEKGPVYFTRDDTAIVVIEWASVI